MSRNAELIVIDYSHLEEEARNRFHAITILFASDYIYYLFLIIKIRWFNSILFSQRKNSNKFFKQQFLNQKTSKNLTSLFNSCISTNQKTKYIRKICELYRIIISLQH